MGFAWTSDVTIGAVSSYLAISPLSANDGRYVSVALSVGLPRPAVNGHPTVRCSDFPPSRRISRFAQKGETRC